MERVEAAVADPSALFVDDTASWQDARGYRLSDRVWSHRQALEQRIDRIIRDGIRDGMTADQVSDELVRYVKPSYARWGGGKARSAAMRLSSNEMNRAYALAERDAAIIDPASGFLEYATAPDHAEADECTSIANRDSGFGRGVYPARDCPLPPRHIGCRCRARRAQVRQRDIMTYVEYLRVEFDLADPPDLTPAEMAYFRRETSLIREAVQIMFRTWFEQTGLVTTEQLIDTSPTVAGWVESVRAQKRRRRL